MDQKGNSIKLYSSQTKIVIKTILKDGVSFSRKEFVERKYVESAVVFKAAYDWFVQEMPNYVTRPEDAQYPYWAFLNLTSVDNSGGNEVLHLDVPLDEVVLFDMYDWIKILKLQYLGESKEDEARFKKKLIDYGIKKESDIILTDFYPELKQEIKNSWKRLFIHNDQLKKGDISGVGSVQAGLWQLKKEWLK